MALPWLPDESRVRITSPATNDYNCIAWALGDDQHWLWPPEPDALTRAGQYWPADLSTAQTIDTFADLFEAHGYQPCNDGELEDGYEKIALYALDNGEPAHASRQRADGAWTSKLGTLVDVEHPTPADVESRPFGRAVRFFRRLRRL